MPMNKMIQSKDTEWQIALKKKKKPVICCLLETHFGEKDTYRLKVRVWEKVFHANGNQI